MTILPLSLVRFKKPLVQLYYVEGDVLQHIEGRKAAAEIVDGHLEPGFVQLAYDPDKGLLFRQEHGFRELYLQKVRGDPVPAGRSL